LNHNIETVARLQRAVRPSAGYARSLSVLARAKAADLTAKSGLIMGMGETLEEAEGTLVDLAGVGVDIVTIGQYLRPTTHHLPVARWVEPAEFDHLKKFGEAFKSGQVAPEHQILSGWSSIYIESMQQSYFNKKPQPIMALAYPVSTADATAVAPSIPSCARFVASLPKA
jgi:lipoate synthase